MQDILLSNAIEGIIIGILSSCPMGPVGVLCIRRTLHRGRKAGFLTGIGASLSDVTYAAIVYLGVGLIINLIETYEKTLTIFGSLLILAFGIFLYLTTPHYKSKKSEQSRQLNVWQTILSSYALTFSNPLIIFFFIAFFGRYHFVHDEPYYWGIFAYSMFFILVGALVWWCLLTWIVGLFREKFSVSSIRTFNRIVAIIFMLVAIGGLLSFFF